MKKDKQKQPSGTVMDIDTILAWLFRMKESAAGIEPNQQADMDACEAAIAILAALQDEGVSTPEQVWDLLYDYRAQTAQYQAMHLKYEVSEKPGKLNGLHICPACRRPNRPGNNHCWNCGKRLGW